RDGVAPDWLNRPFGGGSVSELIARKKYGKAIELLTAQLKGRTPGPQMRLQLADLLILAGRGAEAVPILIALADDFPGDGLVAKAVAILKRVDRIDPGRPEVEVRLVSLVRQQQRSGPSERPAPPAPRSPKLPEIGIEEIDTSKEALLPRPRPAEVEPVAKAEPEPEPQQAAEPPTAAEPEPAPTPAPAVDVPASAPPQTGAAAPDAEGVVDRIRGVFRRFLSPAEGAAAPASVAAAPEPVPAAVEPMPVAAEPVPPPEPVPAAP